MENLRCSREGLTSVAAEERLAIFGHNKLEEKRVLLHFSGFLFFIFLRLMEIRRPPLSQNLVF